MNKLVSSLLGLSFIFGMLGTVSVSHLIFDNTELIMANVAMVLIALVAGFFLARREPFKSFLSSPPVLWFLFLFNLVAGTLALFFIPGTQGVLAGIGLLGASLSGLFGLLRHRFAVVSGL